MHRSLARLTAVPLVVGMLTGVTATPASAQVLPPGVVGPPTVSVDTRNAVPDFFRPFRFTIRQPSFGASPIDCVTIGTNESERVRAVGAQPPDGWTFELGGNGVRFRGGPLGAGGTLTFTTLFDVWPPPPTETAVEWWALASSDGCGFQIAMMEPESSGAMSTTIRLIENRSFEIVGPSGAVDGTVTEGQRLTLRLEVLNRGVEPVTFRPELDFSPSSSFSLEGDSSGQVVNPHEPASFDWYVTPTQANASYSFTARTADPTPSNTGPGDSPVGRTVSFTSQPRTTLAYVAGSLTPRAVPGSSTVRFSMQVDKGPTGAPAITFDRDRTVLEVQGCPPLPVSASGISAGAGRVQLDFASCEMPPVPDGPYPAGLTLAYTDANGEMFATGPSPIDVVTVDATMPQATVSLVPPASRVPGQPPALTNGVAFDVRGEVVDHDPATGQQTPCGISRCTVQSAVLHQFDAGGTVIDGQVDVTSAMELDGGGQLAGRMAVKFDPRARSARLRVVVRDQAGNAVDAISDAVDVDNEPPTIVRATVTRGPGEGEQRRVLVELGECVVGRTSPANWSPVPLVVTEVPGSCPTQIELAFAQDFPDDPVGALAYRPGPGPLVFEDRVGLTVPGAEVAMHDGIVPRAPVISTVSGRPPEDGTFLVNDPAATVVLENPPQGGAIAAGYRIEVFEETNGAEGLQPDEDRLLCAGVADGVTIALPCSLAGGDRTMTVYARSVDRSGNDGDPAAATVVLDTTAPRALSFEVEGNRISVRFDEPIAAGRDAPPDWRVLGVHPERGAMEFSVGPVKAGGAASRVLTFHHPYTSGTVTVAEVRYLFAGDPADRYTDRAGNRVENFTLIA